MIGIYKIENSINGKVYIGQSVDVDKRFKSHIRELRKGKHNNRFLQDDWNTFGEEAFTFELIKKCRSLYLNRNEKTYINEYDSTNREKGYNISKGLGKNMSFYDAVSTTNPVDENKYYRSENGEILYNERCISCKNDCKQSFRSVIMLCPDMR